MPLSQLTRLRAAIIVIGFALTLFCLDASQQAMVGAAAIFVLPVLIWLLVSNAVKEAPPFDDKAFHRTRPVTAARVFRHLARFHLLVLAGLLAVMLAYAWRMNLGWREVAFGTVLLGIPWIALVSLFGTVASLSTSTQHWKGWGFVALLLLPAISVVGLIWAITNKKHAAPNLLGVPVVAAIIYPGLWWLVAAKGRWTLGCLLGLVAGVGIPWSISGIRTPDFTFYLRANPNANPQKAVLSIQRLKGSADAQGMAENQAPVSRLLEIRGLGRDEFIGGIAIYKLRNREEAFPGAIEFDRNLGEMDLTAFSADPNGLLIPATASLFHAMGLEKPQGIRYPVWSDHLTDLDEPALAEFLSLPLRSSRSRNQGNQPSTSDAAAQDWSFGGSVYRWEKVLDTTARKGGRAKLQGSGVISMLPVDPSLSDFQITTIVSKGLYQSDLEIFGLHPVLVGRLENGARLFVAPNGPRYGSRQGFLVRERVFLFHAAWAKSETGGRIRTVENLRLELYWPVLCRSVNLTLPPP